jgi:dihydroxyacetone kinase-like protein
MTENPAADSILHFDRAAQRRLFEALVAAVVVNATELTDLDRAIGDGDHGINLRRGFKAVAEQLDALTELPLGLALRELGKRLVMSVGGASGPLYGTLFMTLGDELRPDAQLSRRQIAAACTAAVAAVRARGKSDAGQKTMLDVLLPVAAELTASGSDLLDKLAERAASAAAATIPMRAQRGRAAYLGERSVGHMDPGARSSELLIAAACASLRERR